MDFKEYRFIDVATLINGRAYLMPELQDSGKYKIVRVGNFTGKDEWFYSDMELEPDKYCEDGDLLYKWACTFGPEIWKGEKTIYHYHIWKVLCSPSILDKKYFFYYLKYHTPLWLSGTNGATMVHITKASMEKKRLSLPSLHTQQKIASILSAYDSQIENNQRRIKLLEQMAENLYTEWFVRFRFPGYETAEFEGGMPKGWKMATIETVLNCFDTIRKPVSSMQRDTLEKKYPYYGAASLMDYIDDYLFDGIYLLMGEDGSVITDSGNPILQYVWGKIWVNNHAHVFQGKGPISTELLYLMFKRMPINDVVTGVAQPKISQGRLFKKKVLVADDKLMESFSQIVEPLFSQIRVLSEQIKHLTTQRDLLLPRLMSGKFEL